MTGQVTSERRLLDSLVDAAREERPDDRSLRHTFAALGFANALSTTSIAAGAISETVGAAAVGGAPGAAAVLEEGAAMSQGVTMSASAGVLGKAGSVGVTLAAPSATVGGAGASGTMLVPAMLAKWFAIGIVAGAGALGAGATVQSRLAAPQPPQPLSAGSPEPIPAWSLPNTPNAARRAAEAPKPQPRLDGAGTGETGRLGVALVASSGSELVTGLPSNRGGIVLPAASEPSPKPAASPLREEVESIERSRSALRASDSTNAIVYAEQYLQRFADGVFVPEAYYLIMEGKLRRGDIDGAQHSASALVARFPSSAQSIKARHVLELR